MQKNNYLTFQDGLNMLKPKAFLAMAKPVGSMCNLNCTYCYYLDKQRFYGSHQSVMDDSLLEKYINEYINAQEIDEVTFLWHGGEPLMAGIDFYKKVIVLQNKHNRSGKSIINTLQTNGQLLNDEWCQFFKEHDFLIGVSVDGPQDLHDTYRRNLNNAGSFIKVMNGIGLLKKHGVDFNALTVVNKLSAGRGKEIYNFLKEAGVEFIQFIPCVDYISSTTTTLNNRPVITSPLKLGSDSILAPWSTTPKDYGQFLIDVFDQWVVNDVGSIFVQLFDLTLAAWCGVDPAVCAYSETCGNTIAVEHNGDVYSCDHFVYPEHLLGNIKETPMTQMLTSDKQFQFGINKRNTLSKECLRCNYYFACKGECPKHRHLKTIDDQYKFSLCEGLTMFYQHTEPYMTFMKEMLEQEKAPALVMEYARNLKENGSY